LIKFFQILLGREVSANDSSTSRDAKALSRFLQYWWPNSSWIFLGLTAIPITVGATLLLPWLVIRIVDDHLMTGQFEGFSELIWTCASVIALGYAADSVYTFSLQKTGQLAIYELRKDLYRHILSLPRIFFDQRPVGSILTRVTSDLEALSESLAAGVLSVLTDLLKTLALLGLLIYISWQLTLIVLVILPVIYFISNFLRAKLRLYYNLTREVLADATGFLQECLNGVKTVQLYAAERKVQKQYEEMTQHFLHAQSRSNFYDAFLFSVIEGITSIAMAIMIWYGTHEILDGNVTVGTLIGFINTLNRIFVPIREFTQQLTVFQRAMSSLENIEILFREQPDVAISKTELPNEINKKLRRFENLNFENVCFRYSQDTPYVLKGITFEVKQGDRIAIVGSTGSGKSTILRLLTRTYTNYEGSIRINGVELSAIPREELQRLIALLQQETYLFEETVGFNISLGKQGIGSTEIEEAARYVYASKFIENLPGKFNFQLLENGKNLSEGQARLLVFARAIAGKSDLFVLDEATSSVDSATENLIQKAIERIFEDKTVIAIAHRLSTIRNSTNILVIQNGLIRERGNHEELLRLNGVYAQLLQTLEQQSSSLPETGGAQQKHNE
jgi:ATP-binding cassette subfamily B protein